MLFIFGALKIELSHLLRLVKIDHSLKKGKTKIYSCSFKDNPVVLINTGVGPENTIKAVKYLKDNLHKNGLRYKVEGSLALMIGLCGAADTDLVVGDVVLYRSIKSIRSDLENHFIEEDTIKLKLKDLPGAIEEYVFKKADSGSLFRTITDPLKKKHLNKKFGVEAIDMESFWVGQAVLKMGLPFYCIRVVSDSAEDILPAYFESSSNIRMISLIILSLIRSIFSKKERRMNINTFKNLKKANKAMAGLSKKILTLLTGTY